MVKNLNKKKGNNFQKDLLDYLPDFKNQYKTIEIKASTKNDKILSPFRYPGSKARAVKFIKEVWEKSYHDEYREPLVGGGGVFFGKKKVKYNWLNDLDKELMITYKFIADPNLRIKLIEKVSKEIASKERHQEIKIWRPKTDLDIAYRYFYLNRTSYSGIMKKPAWGYHPKKSVPPSRWGPRIELASRKLEGVKLTSLDYHEVINALPTGNHVFIFVDPPYFKADQKRAYKFYFTLEDHIALCNVLKHTNYDFCLTYDDCEEVRELYEWAEIYPVSWRYHTANARKAERKMGMELIISNF